MKQPAFRLWILPVVTVVLLVAGNVGGTAGARESLASPKSCEASTPPVSPPRLPQEADTLWFGGDDGSGIAVLGGIWDWDTDLPPGDPLQGWFTVDQSVYPGTWFRRITHADAGPHGDECDPVFGDTGALIWCGLHEDEAILHDFVAGLGYGNAFSQEALSPEFAIDPATESISIDFRYFNDTEEEYDFTHALIIGYDDDAAEIQEYEIAEFTGVLGAPESPETFAGGVGAGMLDPDVVTARLAFRMTSDGGWSDEDGDYDTRCGAFAADDVEIHVGESFATTYTFEDDTEGWTFGTAGIGAFMAVVDEVTWLEWLDEAGVTDCSMSGNALSFTDIAGSPWWPPGHPHGHHELAHSGVVPRSEIAAEELLGAPVQFDTYVTPSDVSDCSCYRIGYTYYPYTTPENPTWRWSPRQGMDTWFMSGEASCHLTGVDLMYGANPLPAEWDSMRVVYEVMCSTMSGDDCMSMGAPMIDNLRAGFAFEDTGGIEDEPVADAARHPSLAPARLDLHNGSAELSFHLPAAAEVVLAIFDAGGRCVRTLCSQPLEAGEHRVIWDGCDDEGRRVARGLYRARLRTTGGFAESRSVLIFR